MAFKLGNTTVIHDSDAGAAIESTSDLDVLKINGTDVLVHDGSTITLKNVDINDAIEGSISTDNVTEGSTNKFYATSLFDTDLATKTTDDLTEGSTNFYYTDAKVDARIITNSGAAIGSSDLDMNGNKVLFGNMYATEGDLPNATTYHGMFAHVHATGKGYFAHGGNWIKLIDETSSDTDDLAEGTNLYYTDARVDARITASDTDALSEGSTNLYFTDARADARITNALGGNVIIGGDLTVSGTTTTIDTNELNIGDNIITLNSDETGAPSQNAGIEVERGTSDNVGIRWNETSDAWEFTNDGTSYNSLGSASTFSGNTDGVSEGSTNLYYTDARVQTYIGGDRTHGGITADSLTGTGSLSIKSGGDYVYIRGSGNGNMFAGKNAEWSAMYYNDNIKVQTTNTGVDITGDLVASGDVTAYSDERLKRNIETISNPIDLVNCLRGVNFEKDGRHSTGVIAQEVEEFLPEVVHTDSEGMKSVAYGNIAGLLIEAIKEQQQTIEELQKQIQDLQNKE